MNQKNKRKTMRVASAKPPARPVDPTKLRPATADELNLPGAPDEAYLDRAAGLCVQVWWNATPGCDGTPWAGTLRVAIKYTRATTPWQAGRRGFDKPLTWNDMQAIKDHYWPGRIAMEIYPPKDRVVDVADMRWMWVLPAGAQLPFNLQSSSIEILPS